MGILDALVRELMTRVRNLVFRGVVLRMQSKRGGLVVQVRGRADELRDDLLVLTPFGVGGYPPQPDGSGAPEGLVVQLDNGNRVVLPLIDRRHFAAAGLGAPDTSALWNTLARVRCLPDGTVEIRGKRLDAAFEETAAISCGGQMTLSASEIYADTSHLKVKGDVTDSLNMGNLMSMNQMRMTYDAHTHPENDEGGPTDPPNQKMGA